VGQEVVLDASASSDPDGDPLLFSWRFVSRPAGSQAALIDPGTAGPRFTPDLPGRYVLEVTVDDGFGGQASDQVTITATEDPILLALLDLIDLVRSISFSPECQSARETLLGFLEGAESALLDQRFEDAVNSLESFISEVQAQTGTCLTQDQADLLLTQARDLLNLIFSQLVLKGDVDGDGRVTILDARLAWEAAVGLRELTRLQFLAADVDNDGQVTQQDAHEIARIVVQTPSSASAAKPLVLAQKGLWGYRFSVQGVGVFAARLEIYSLQGQRVYTSGWKSAHHLWWAMRSDRGERVANGVYLYVVYVRDAQGRLLTSRVEKLMVLR